MEFLKRNDWSKINEAYQIFINTGHILPNTVRGEIENSWKRSQRLVAPWTPRPEPIDDVEFDALLKANEELMTVSGPVLQFMYATNGCGYEDNIAQLVEKTGVVMAICTRLCSFPTCIKKRVRESTIGTSMVATVIEEQKALEIGGAEIYKLCFQTCFGGAAPIKDRNGMLIGVLSLYNMFGKIPDQPLELVEAAAHLIEDLLKDMQLAYTKSIISYRNFTRMINSVDYYILVIDDKGKIVSFNDKFENLLEIKRESIIGKHCKQFGINLDEIISDYTYVNKDTFKIKTPKQEYFCLLQNNKTVKWLNNDEYTLLLFSIAAAPQKRIKVINYKGNKNALDTIIGRSSDNKRFVKMAKRAATVPTNVLLDGESGTGKEVFARAIHNASVRASKPFIAINCGAIPKEILQSELFGYEDGAFTGGKKGGQIGKFEAADGGTVLLDEIGEMPLEMQVSLLRFLQDKAVTRVGSQQAKVVDVRIIAATNRDLQELVANGLFRKDLYYRLNVIRITLTPLRNRKDDIMPIAEYYIEHYSNLYGLKKMTISQETQKLLYQYNWPGNVRELINVIEKAVVYSEGSQITPDLLPREILMYQPGLSTITPENFEQREKEIIVRTLNTVKGNVSEAAKLIGISRNTLYRKLDKYQLHCLKRWDGQIV